MPFLVSSVLLKISSAESVGERRSGSDMVKRIPSCDSSASMALRCRERAPSTTSKPEKLHASICFPLCPEPGHYPVGLVLLYRTTNIPWQQSESLQAFNSQDDQKGGCLRCRCIFAASTHHIRSSAKRVNARSRALPPSPIGAPSAARVCPMGPTAIVLETTTIPISESVPCQAVAARAPDKRPAE